MKKNQFYLYIFFHIFLFLFILSFSFLSVEKSICMSIWTLLPFKMFRTYQRLSLKKAVAGAKPTAGVYLFSIIQTSGEFGFRL